MAPANDLTTFNGRASQAYLLAGRETSLNGAQRGDYTAAADSSESRSLPGKSVPLLAGRRPDVDVHVGIAGMSVGMHRAQVLVEGAQPQLHHIVVHFLD